MSSPDFTAAPYPFYAGNGAGRGYAPELVVTRQRYWVHVLLFLLTLFTTTVVGAGMQHDFARNLPYDIERGLAAFSIWWSHPSFLIQGLPFSLTLLTILLAHEFGHYCACAFYRVDASLPYFLPGPPVMGTFGAFIRIRSAVYSRRVLFDIGIAGPLAGFIFLLPALAIGLAYSKVIPGIAHEGSFRFGIPALQWLLQNLIFPGVSSADLYLHPVARAAWIGIVATALNLLPIGQLDGGHILYSFVGAKHRLISKLFVMLLVPMAVFWPAWLLWATILFFLGRRHPVIYDSSELGPGRKRLGWLALGIFLSCFTLAPLSPGGL